MGIGGKVAWRRGHRRDRQSLEGDERGDGFCADGAAGGMPARLCAFRSDLNVLVMPTLVRASRGRSVNSSGHHFFSAAFGKLDSRLRGNDSIKLVRADDL